VAVYPVQRASSFPRTSLVAAYVRSQLAAGLATLVDFAVMVGLVELCKVYYLSATAIGALSGGITAFVVNRHWSFIASHRALSRQAVRYALVWIGSLSLNCLLMWLMTDHGGLAYTYSKVVTAISVGALFNFPLHRYFVFR
jgi:putative flippase GtrA